MKRATLTAIPAATPATAAGDLTDRLLNREPVQANAAAKAGRARPSQPQPRTSRPHPRAAEPAPVAAKSDSLGQALAAAQQAVEALQAAGRSEPARYEVALRFRLDSLAHHLQQVKDYVAATLTR